MRGRVARAGLVGLVGLLGLLGLAGCEPPSPDLRLRLSEGPAQRCPSTDCLQIPMACPTWISIRILDPREPSAPFLSQCQRVSANAKSDLCSVASVKLEVKTLPLRDLEIQVALYPESAIEFAPLTDEPICPTDVQYDAVNGFPVESPTAPALGGRAYYRAGDEEFVVTLGCSHLGLLNDATCVGTATVAVAATVNVFDTLASVTPGLGDQLNVSVGEPVSMDTSYILNPAQSFELDRRVQSPPAWGADVAQMFTSAACLVVLDSAPESTSLLSCRSARPTDTSLDFTGHWLSKTSLDQVLAALALPQFPAAGITIGIVVDDDGSPLPNQVVTAPGGTVQYLSADRSTVGGTATSASGVFVSTDAPFLTVFATTGGAPPKTVSQLGGIVEGKVTLVALRFDAPVVGGEATATSTSRSRGNP